MGGGDVEGTQHSVCNWSWSTGVSTNEFSVLEKLYEALRPPPPPTPHPQNGDNRVNFLFLCFQMNNGYMGALIRDDVFHLSKRFGSVGSKLASLTKSAQTHSYRTKNKYAYCTGEKS